MKTVSPRVKNVNYYGFDHERVAKTFEGGLTYVGDFSIEGVPRAIYHCANPNVEKGYKKYVLLWTNARDFWINGMTPEQLAEHSIHEAVLCENCNTALYSLHRHHYHTCDCENGTFVDGGRDYLRYGGVDPTRIATGKLDLLSGQFTLNFRA